MQTEIDRLSAENRRLRKEVDDLRFELAASGFHSADPRYHRKVVNAPWNQDAERLTLTPSEAGIMDQLYYAMGRNVTKQALMAGMYCDRDEWPESKIVDVFIAKGRKKIEGCGFWVETVWGIGYRMVEDPDGWHANQHHARSVNICRTGRPRKEPHLEVVHG